MNRFVKRKNQNKEIASERIAQLFKLAQEEFPKSPELSNRYVALARRIQQKYKVRMPSEFKRRYCKHCNDYIVSGKTGRVRVNNKSLITFCNSCQKTTRFRIKK